MRACAGDYCWPLVPEVLPPVVEPGVPVPPSVGRCGTLVPELPLVVPPVVPDVPDVPLVPVLPPVVPVPLGGVEVPLVPVLPLVEPLVVPLVEPLVDPLVLPLVEPLVFVFVLVFVRFVFVLTSVLVELVFDRFTSVLFTRVLLTSCSLTRVLFVSRIEPFASSLTSTSVSCSQPTSARPPMARTADRRM